MHVRSHEQVNFDGAPMNIHFSSTKPWLRLARCEVIVVAILPSAHTKMYMQVNKNGEIQNRAELEFRQHSAHSTTELKTQRSLCYAAGQDPGGQHQPPLILQDFSPEYASIFPKSKKMAKNIQCMPRIQEKFRKNNFHNGSRAEDNGIFSTKAQASM